MASGIINFDWTVTKLTSRIVWESTANIANNTSSVTANLQIKRTDSYYTSGTWEVYFYGAKYDDTYFETNQFTPRYEASDVKANVTSSWTTVATITNTALPHNDSGIADIAFYAKIFAPDGTTQAGAYAEIDTRQDGGIRLDTIYRKANILSAPNFTDEDNPTITYSNPAGSSVSALQACISWTGVDDISYRDISPTGSSYTFNFTDEERKKLWAAVSGSNSRTVNFYITTNIGGNILNSSTPATLTIINAQPTITVNAIDTNAASVQLTGNDSTIIKGFNHIYTDMTPQVYKGASISEMSITNGGTTEYDEKTELINTEDNVIIYQLIDSRGNAVRKTITMPMINYIPLTANIDAEIGLSESGSNKAEIKFKIYGNYYSGSFGAQDNTLTVEYTLESGTGASSYHTLPVPAENINNNTYFVEYTIYDLDYKNTYTIIAQASDKVVQNVASPSKVLKAVPVFDWGENDFNFNVPISIQGKPVADFVVEQGISGIWKYKKWNSGRIDCVGKYAYNFTSNYGTQGSMYTRDVNIAIPSGLFNAIPDCAVGAIDVGGFVCPYLWKSTTTGLFVQLYTLLVYDTNNSCTLSLQISGTWK